ncbi:MAG: DUF1573 domain-containing protein [Verrucomicrobia bacterium]|nr:MAG: DUF1573 domain-containing protein [Verrucomicrobiota bacterium]
MKSKFVTAKRISILCALLCASASAQTGGEKTTRILPQRVNPPASDYIPPAPPIAPPSTNAAPASAALVELPKTVLAFDGEFQETSVKPGAAETKFTFNLTNVSPEAVTITSVHTSCGCTVAQLPSLPWTIPPGSNGQINVTMNLAGKSGIVFKTVTVTADKGVRQLTVKTTFLPPDPPPMSGNRAENQKVALVDRQAVFKGDCARCHVEPGRNRMGKELYTAVCGVCHEAEHRATMVPDLHALKKETSPTYWRMFINFGKDASMMPAFAQERGGPLSPEQVESLVDYLTITMPSKPADAAPSAK